MSGKPYVSRILIYPIKGLDPVEVSQSRITPKGSLEYDRFLCLLDEEGNIISGKKEKRMHTIRSYLDLELGVLKFSYEGASYNFTLEESKAIEDFFSEVFGYRVFLKKDPAGGFPDDRKAHGPTIVSTSTLLELAGWYNLSEDNIRRRFRANIEVGGVPPFWEDSLAGESAPRKFRVGDVLMEGVGISKRCPVPTRDPFSGQEFKGFVKTFVENRKKSLPPWAPMSRFSDTFYRLCLNTVVPESESGKRILVGDEVVLS